MVETEYVPELVAEDRTQTFRPAFAPFAAPPEVDCIDLNVGFADLAWYAAIAVRLRTDVRDCFFLFVVAACELRTVRRAPRRGAEHDDVAPVGARGAGLPYGRDEQNWDVAPLEGFVPGACFQLESFAEIGLAQAAI